MEDIDIFRLFFIYWILNISYAKFHCNQTKQSYQNTPLKFDVLSGKNYHKGNVGKECTSLVRLRLVINISKSIDNTHIEVYICRFRVL